MTQLLLLRFSAMGDVALLAPVVQAFTRQYPDVMVTLVTRPKFAVFFEGLANVRVVAADFGGRHQGSRGLLRLFSELRALGPYRLVVDAHQNLRTAVLKSLFRLVGVPSVTIDKGRAAKKALTRREHKVCRPLPHAVERYAHLFDRAGFRLDLRQPTHFAVGADAETELTAFLNQQTLPTDTPWLGIAPFAQHAQKMWPFERISPLLTQLSHERRLTVFLFGGGPAEIAQLDTLRIAHPNTIRVAGQLSLAAELALIRRLDGMLCMDSGNMHLAALSGVPVVSIWGATHPDAGFGPWGQGAEAIVQVPVDVLTCRPCSVFGNKPCWRGDLACLQDIPVDVVANRVLTMLATR